jgi:hypothetical protein
MNKRLLKELRNLYIQQNQKEILQNDYLVYFDESNIFGNITYNNNTQVSTYVYDDKDGTVTQGCFHVYKVTNGVRTYYNTTCVNYSSAAISAPTPPQNGSSYYLKGTVTKSNQDLTIQTYTINGLTSLPDGGKSGLFVLLLLLVVCSLMATFSIQLSVVMAGLSIFLTAVTGIILIPLSTAVVILLLCVAMAVLLR